jgi:hypothetical protein
MVRLLAAALLVGTPISASAQFIPSKPDAVADAVASCWAAVGSKAVDQAVLARSGWKPGSIADPRGARINTPLQVYGKAGSNVVLMLMSTAKLPACSVVSRVSSASDVSLAAQAVQRRLTSVDPQVKTARSGPSIVFLALPKIAMLDATGTKAKPSVRIVVSYNNPGKK